MQSKRNIVLKELDDLAEEVKNSTKVLSDRKWEEEHRQIRFWIDNDGTTSNVSEINEQIAIIKLKVRVR